MRLLAGCVIANAAGALLLIHRNQPGQVHWELPGGKVEPGEQAAVAASRELLEELGVTVAVSRRIGACTFMINHDVVRYEWFSATIVSGTPTPLEPGHDDVAYLGWAEIAARPDISPNLRLLVQKFPHGVADRSLA